MSHMLMGAKHYNEKKYIKSSHDKRILQAVPWKLYFLMMQTTK